MHVQYVAHKAGEAGFHKPIIARATSAADPTPPFQDKANIANRQGFTPVITIVSVSGTPARPRPVTHPTFLAAYDGDCLVRRDT